VGPVPSDARCGRRIETRIGDDHQEIIPVHEIVPERREPDQQRQPPNE
jgi:hypothetical protein